MRRDTLRRLIVLVAAVLAAAATARLGLWQLSRAAEKSALHEMRLARGKEAPVGLAELARDAGQAALQLHRRVRIQGRWLGDHTIFLQNRQMNGATGFYVVTPLELAPGDAVLVQRGWAPRHALDRTALPALETPDGLVDIAGTIAASPARLYEFGPDAAGPIRQNLDPGEFSREIGIALRPITIEQTGADGTDALQRQWPRPERDVAKHHGYAFQWFGLSALITVLYVWFQLIAPRLRRAP